MLADRRSRLRSATESAHRRLDGVVEDAGYFRDRPSYTAYLRATLSARRPLELALNHCGVDKLFDRWPDRIIAPALCADIQDVTETAASTESNSVIPGEGFSMAQAIGTLYVLEGSALGARHFAQQTANPKTWSAFLRVLEAMSFDVSQEDECIAASKAAFYRFECAYAGEIFGRLRDAVVEL